MTDNHRASAYKYHFVSEPDDGLKCLICLEIAEEPWQHGECGKLFCKKCLDRLGPNKSCPNCRWEHPQYLKDGRSKRDIRALPVKCDNVNAKCEWVGTVSTLEEHVATCEFARLPCPKQCTDNHGKIEHFLRKDLDEHLKKDCPNRDYMCEYCGENGTYTYVSQVHDKTCPNKILLCPSGCNETMPRYFIKEHLGTECEWAVVSCRYKQLGCNKVFLRRDRIAHEENDQHHLHMAIETTTKLKSALEDASIRTAQLEVYLKETLDRIVKLEGDLVKKISDVNEAMVTRIAALEDRSITLKNGEPMRFKFTTYQKTKDEDGEVLSPSYYTPNGYHMAIRVYANGRGIGKGTHVSVCVPILEGKYDANLKWPLFGKVTITLLNQLEDANHKELTMLFGARSKGSVGSNWGFHRFISHSELACDPVKNTQYLKDDTLYFRASVEVAKHKPWLE